MSRKLHGALPACFVMVAALLIGYFCITGISVGDSTAAGSQEVAQISAQDVSVKTVNASVAAVETLVPQDAVNEADENLTSAVDVSFSEFHEEDVFDSGYVLTDSERIAVECAVMCEAGGEGAVGQMMVAQSILDGTLRNDFNVFETIYAYQIHSTSYSNVTDEVRESVARVFDEGERVTEEKTDLWYNPALVESEWHEDQRYIITVGSHRFFWMNDDM